MMVLQKFLLELQNFAKYLINMEVILLTGVSGIIFQRSMGAYQLAHHLRDNKFSCQVIDFINDFNEKELLNTIEKFITDKTLCIGISTTFLSNIRIGIDNKSKLPLELPPHVSLVCKKLKEKFPKIKFCLGGAKSNYGDQYGWIDSIFHGYAEDEFLNFCRNLKQNKKNPFTKKVNGKEIYEKANSEFHIEHLNHRFKLQDCITRNETLPIEISRGCIFKCKFCAYPLNGKKKIDYIRDAKLISQEMLNNYEQYQVTNYFFADDTFNDSTYKLEMLYNEISKLPFKIKFTAYLRLDLLYSHRDMIKLLKDMGMVSAFFGIESFCQESLKCIGKNIKVEKIKTFLDELYFDHWEEQINFNLGFIAGLPGEDRKSILDTVSWLSTRPYSFHFEPLRLSDAGGGNYQSEFQKDHLKFGYQFDENKNWYNDFIDEAEAEILADSINREYAYNKNKPEAWTLMSLLNHFDYSYLKEKTFGEIKYRDILRTKQKRILEYKTMLNNIEIEAKNELVLL
jgi:radical SAM superfamily enzyme YgiQ (UPF0313 family)